MARRERREATLRGLLTMFDAAASYRSHYEDRAEELYKLYVSFIKPRTDGRSNLFIPKAFASLAAFRARLFGMLIGTRPWCDFSEVGSEDKQAAKIAASFVEHQSQTTGFRLQFWTWLTNLLVYPASVAYVGWRYESRPRRIIQDMPLPSGLTIHLDTTVDETIIDDNELRAVDFWDFWPDPAAGTIDDARFVFHREWATQEQIEDYLEVLEIAGKGKVTAPDWDTIRKNAPADQMPGPSRRANSVGNPTPQSLDGLTSEKEEYVLHELLHFWQDDRHAVIIDRAELVYDGPNPYDHGKKPFVATSYEPVQGEFYGLSQIHLAEHLQHELNTTRNQRIDNVSMVINRGWFRKNPNISDDQLVSRPNVIIDIEQDGDVTPMITPDVTSSAYSEEAIIERNIDEVLATPAQFRGAGTSKRETATELTLLSEGAGTRVEATAELIEEAVLKRIAMLFDLNNKQFVDKERVTRLYGQAGEQWATVKPLDLRRQFDYVPASAATDAAANKSLRRQQLLEVVQVVSQNPMLVQSVNLPALVRLLLENYDVKNLDEIVQEQPPVMPALPGAGPAMPGAGPQLPPAAGATINSAMMQGMTAAGGLANQV